MPSIAVIGAQWGDEGKGKITDYEAGKADMVVRYQGGSIAGHTIQVGEEVFALHILPSGIVRPGVVNVIGNGVIVDLISLDREIAEITSRGRSVDGLRISDRANIILNWHRLLDGAEERLRGKKGVGTTGKGIGPCYSDNISRSGIRMGDLLDAALLEERLDTIMPMKLKVMEILGVRLAQNRNELLEELLAYGKKYANIITDTTVTAIATARAARTGSTRAITTTITATITTATIVTTNTDTETDTIRRRSAMTARSQYQARH